MLKQILDPNFGASTRLQQDHDYRSCGCEAHAISLQRLTEAMPQAKLHNRYASTEIGTVAAMWDVTDESLASGEEIPIGRPVANTRIYILDRYMNPVPVGVAGEICVARRAPSSWISESARFDGGTLHSGSVQRRIRAKTLSDWRSRTIQIQRRDRVCRPGRSSGQDQWLSSRFAGSGAKLSSPTSE